MSRRISAWENCSKKTHIAREKAEQTEELVMWTLDNLATSYDVFYSELAVSHSPFYITHALKAFLRRTWSLYLYSMEQVALEMQTLHILQHRKSRMNEWMNECTWKIIYKKSESKYTFSTQCIWVCRLVRLSNTYIRERCYAFQMHSSECMTRPK